MGPNIVIIALFHGHPDPVSQKQVFSRLKAVVSPYKNLKTVAKKYNRIKFGIQDVMNGLTGVDRLNAKAQDFSTVTISDYVNVLTNNSEMQYKYRVTKAKESLTKKKQFSNTPFHNTSNELITAIREIQQKFVQNDTSKGYTFD